MLMLSWFSGSYYHSVCQGSVPRRNPRTTYACNSNGQLNTLYYNYILYMCGELSIKTLHYDWILNHVPANKWCIKSVWLQSGLNQEMNCQNQLMVILLLEICSCISQKWTWNCGPINVNELQKIKKNHRSETKHNLRNIVWFTLI